MSEQYYQDLSIALAMLEKDCEPLKFEVFMTFIELIRKDERGELCKSLKSVDLIMIEAMASWDLIYLGGKS